MDNLDSDAELLRLNEYLDEFELKCGLPASINENTINKATEIINLDFTTLRPTQEECQEYAAILSQYLINLGRVIAKEKSIVHWAKELLKKTIVKNLSNQKAYNYEERVAAAINENSTAGRLNQMRVKAELRLMRLENTYFSIKDLASRLGDWGKSLRGIK